MTGKKGFNTKLTKQVLDQGRNPILQNKARQAKRKPSVAGPTTTIQLN